MALKFVAVICLMHNAASNMLQSTAVVDEDLLSAAASAVTDVVKASASTQSSLLLLTDGATSSSCVCKVLRAVESAWGVGVFEVKATQRLRQNVSVAHFSPVVAQARQLRTASRDVTLIVASDDPTFLSTFAESSKQGRLLTWATRLLVVTRMTSQKLRDLVASHWTFSRMNVVVLNSEGKRRGGGRRYSLYSHLPYQPEGPRMVKVGTWTPKLSLRLRGSLFQEKYANFYGAQVNVTSQTFIPKWKEKIVKLPDGREVIHYSGMDYQALAAIADALNFSVNVIPTANFQEATAKVEEGNAFLVAVGYSIIPGRLERYDFTRAFDTYKTSFAMPNPKPQPSWYSLVYPLSYEVWLSIGAALAGTSLVLSLVTHYQGNQGPGLCSIAQVVYKILLGQDLVQRFVRNPSTRLIISCWLAFSLIIGAAYRSNLTTSLTVPKEPPKIETIQELVGSADRVLIPSYGKDWINFYLNSESEIYRKLGTIMHMGTTIEEEMSRLEHNHALIESHLLLNYIIAKDFTDADGRGKLYVGKSFLLTTFSAWPIPHDAPYKQQLDRCLVAFTESGLFLKWERDIFREAERENIKKQREAKKRSGEAESDESTSKALTVSHFQGPLLLLVLGLVVALVTFLAEVVLQCRVFGCR